MAQLNINDIDLATIKQLLAKELGGDVEGYVVGKTRMRDALVARLRCSMLEAEQLIDSMVSRGILAFEADPDGAGVWRFP